MRLFVALNRQFLCFVYIAELGCVNDLLREAFVVGMTFIVSAQNCAQPDANDPNFFLIRDTFVFSFYFEDTLY